MKNFDVSAIQGAQGGEQANAPVFFGLISLKEMLKQLNLVNFAIDEIKGNYTNDETGEDMPYHIFVIIGDSEYSVIFNKDNYEKILHLSKEKKEVFVKVLNGGNVRIKTNENGEVLHKSYSAKIVETIELV